MPVSLPPPVPPQLVESLEVTSAGESLAELEFRGYRLHVSGPAGLRRLPYRAIVGGARSLSDAVYRLGSSAYAAGYPGAQALYAVDDHDIEVTIVLGRIARIEGDPRLTRFFRDAMDRAPLESSTLERDRALASLQADRLGLAARVTLVPGAEGTRVLRIESQEAPGVDALRADFGNGGNRYVGRYLASVGGTVADPAGDEFVASVRRGVTPLNEDGVSYGDQSLRVSRVTPGGALAASVQHVSFSRPLGGVDTDNRLWQYGVMWLYPAYADLTRRATVQVSLDRTERRGDAEPSGTLFFEEAYTSGQVSASYSRASYPSAGHRVSVDSGLSLRQGFGPHDPALSNADLGYVLGRASFGIGTKEAGALRLRLEGNGQWSRDTLPEQQQWVLGGSDNLTAYLPGVAVGDNGYGVRAEARWERPAGMTTPTPRVFAEYGRVHLHRGTAGQPDGNASAADAGIALEFTGRSALGASVACAWPLAREGLADATWDASRVALLFTLRVTLK